MSLMQGNPAFQAIERAILTIGYSEDLLRRSYRYTDVLVEEEGVQPERTIDLAAFAQKPHTYRNACIGVIVSNGASGVRHVSQYTAVGAPLIFEIDGPIVNRWKIAAQGEPEIKETFSVESIERAFASNRRQWEPDSILRAKAIGEPSGPIQLDFVDAGLMPFLEGRNFEKLDHLLREVLTKCTTIYKRVNQRKPSFENLFPLAFRFIAAKVFRDRGYTGGWQSDDALTALQAIEEHYNVGSDRLPPSAINDRSILDPVWSIILGLFRFPNLSEDDLALVFEKTFITPHTRKTLGVHSTPPRVAEYIVRKLPFHKIPEHERHVLEPFAGHGRFLVSAMKRMKELLPRHLSESERHDYLVNRLVGIELDQFSVEVSRLSLMMADEPNPNGWRLYNEDVFATGRLERELTEANIVLCNPPFEDFTQAKRRQYQLSELLTRKPAEVLRRILMQPPDLLGLVVPSVFISGSSYRNFHSELAENYGSIELVALPQVFNYSEATTMLIMASERQTRSTAVSVTCRWVMEGASREAFLRYGTEPPAINTVVDPADLSRPDFSLWVSPLSRVWAYLRDYPRLINEAEIHQGIKWKAASTKRGKKLDKYISATPKPGYVKGYARVEDRLSQYWIRPEDSYLSLLPQDQYDNAYQYPWDQPKVVCNAARRQRSPWRVAAIADPLGWAFSQRFMAFWPERISIYGLTALLNSPVCNAFLFSTEGERSPNHKRTFERLPIPPDLSFFEKGGSVDVLTRDLHKQAVQRDSRRAKQILLQIDAQILTAYDLPPNLEREVLDIFQGEQRPVPFHFAGFYPEHLEAYIPLSEIISPEFFDARADRLLQRLTFISDPVISDAMAMLHSDHTDDEGLPS